VQLGGGMERIGIFRETRPSLRTRDLSATETTQALTRKIAGDEGGPRGSFLSSGGLELAESAVAPRPRLGPLASNTLRLHFQVCGDAGVGRETRVVDVPWGSVPESTLQSLSPFVLTTGNGVKNLFLTVPDRANGLLRPADSDLGSYATLPLRIPSSRLVRFRAKELLRTLADTHRVARRELDEMRERVRIAHATWIDDALFGPADHPDAALFTAGEGDLWRHLQGRFPSGSRLAFTPQVPNVVRTWWQVGDTTLLRTRNAGLRSDLLDGTLLGLRARFRSRPGSILAFEGVEQILETLPLADVLHLVQGAREEAQRAGGKVWLSWDPRRLTGAAVRELSRGFEEVSAKTAPVWTLSGVGEEARLVPIAPSTLRALSEEQLPRPTLGEWLSAPEVAEAPTLRELWVPGPSSELAPVGADRN
jgi:hypothetical protein